MNANQAGIVLCKFMTAVAGCLSIFSSCSNESDAMLRYALEQAGDNRPELESVLEHYRTADDNPEKLVAARYLIGNLPAHYSYADGRIHNYYEYAARILANTSLAPEQQRDSLLASSDSLYGDLPMHTIPDARIIEAGYIIDNIDRSYAQWRGCPWAGQITFDEYLEWLLPYKAVELQELDAWRDTLPAHFGGGLLHPIRNDVEYNTTMGVADMLRNDAQSTMHRHGLYTRAGLPLLSAYLLPRQTFGNIPDYALVAVLLMRSAGIPAVIDETPVGARYEAASRWFVIIADKGEEEASEWDLSTNIGWGFFPYERGPKVYRNSLAINKERFEYSRKAGYRYQFDIGKQDVTDRYFLVSDIGIPVGKSIRRKLKDKYVYIASAVRDSIRPWRIVDLGRMRRGRAEFRNMGREVLYQAFGYDGDTLVPLASPFILHKDRTIEYISADTLQSAYLDRWKNNALL